MAREGPAIPVAVRQHGEKIEWDANRQQLTPEIEWTVTPKDWDRAREGYLCLNCWIDQDQPFPEKCRVCRYLMRALQRRDMERLSHGDDDGVQAENIGSQIDLGWELDRIDEKAEMVNLPSRKHRRIYVPDWVDV